MEFPQNSAVGQQRQQIPELQFDEFTTPSAFLSWKIRFRNRVTKCPKVLGLPVKLAAPDHLEKMENPTDPSLAETPTNAQQRGNLVQEYGRKIEQVSEDQKFSKLYSDAGLKLVETGQYLYTLIQKKDHRCNIYI